MKYCSCCGNATGCDCHSPQSSQAKRIADLEAELAAAKRQIEADRTKVVDIANSIK